MLQSRLLWCITLEIPQVAASYSLFDTNYITFTNRNHARWKYKFKKYFSFMVIPASFCYYCPSCFTLIDTTINTICAVCKRVFKSTTDLTYFLHLPISHQILALFAKANFYEDIFYRFQRHKLHEDSYEDIYDRSLYKKFMSSDGILNNRNNLSLGMWMVFHYSNHQNLLYGLCIFLLMNCHINFEHWKKTVYLQDCVVWWSQTQHECIIKTNNYRTY